MRARRQPAIAAALALGAALALAWPAAAPAASAHCSPTGDLCYGVEGASPPVRLGLTMAARNFRAFRLCVTGPDGRRDCRAFRVVARAHGTFGRVVRWSRHFPNRGHGTYRARWLNAGRALGPAITFRRSGGPSIRVTPVGVRAGRRVRVFGSAGGCAPGAVVTLISRAFPHTHDFAGLPAVQATVQPNDRYAVAVRIPSTRTPGRYTITGRCGGGAFGVTRMLTVLGPA